MKSNFLSVGYISRDTRCHQKFNAYPMSKVWKTAFGIIRHSIKTRMLDTDEFESGKQTEYVAISAKARLSAKKWEMRWDWLKRGNRHRLVYGMKLYGAACTRSDRDCRKITNWGIRNANSTKLVRYDNDTDTVTAVSPRKYCIEIRTDGYRPSSITFITISLWFFFLLFGSAFLFDNAATNK